MRSPFVDSASFLPSEAVPLAASRRWLLTLALVVAVAASSAILLAF
jgi:hypothetical protein